MSKSIWNPLNPDTNSTKYERRVGDVLQEQFNNNPQLLASLFQSLTYNSKTLSLLVNARLRRRTFEKSRWEGASGCFHQIDESFSTDDESIIVLVECKCMKKSVRIPEFSTLLMRVIDIAAKEQQKIVLGILVTNQGPQGRFGGDEEHQDCISKLQTHFSKIGHCIAIQWLPD